MTAGGAGLPLWPHPLCLGVVWRPHSPGAPNSHTGRGALFGVSTVLLSQPASSRPWNDRRGVRTAGGMLTGRASCERGRYFRYSMGTSWSVL